jgi:hypothetical protein
LGGRDAIAQGIPEISRYSAVEKFAHKALNALEEFRGRRFGKSNSDDFLWRNGRGNQEGDPACHERGLTATCSGLYEKGSIVLGQRREACRGVRERRG